MKVKNDIFLNCKDIIQKSIEKTINKIRFYQMKNPYVELASLHSLERIECIQVNKVTYIFWYILHIGHFENKNLTKYMGTYVEPI